MDTIIKIMEDLEFRKYLKSRNIGYIVNTHKGVLVGYTFCQSRGFTISNFHIKTMYKMDYLPEKVANDFLSSLGQS